MVVWCLPIIEGTANAADADTDVSDNSHDKTKYYNDDDPESRDVSDVSDGSI